MIIERSDAEYMQEIKELYEKEVKPYIQKGKSFTYCMNKLKLSSTRYSRKYRELRKMALEDGYKFQGANHK